ncbi:protein of unknown function [Blastococcus sp. DSM 46786]|uniref:HNH endonuclease signature motif containing protein n=1 Tax=Blastococcus sp. DSM 46786 TaxID=1798227 RepID=UPI0008C2765D|nr:HNH endonuclease signature motif containing protein [Blastococcus sp. DSM 46786]SEL78075.1 protein of unknown function [Blastococcus sp. DSM 46786]
MIEYMAQAAAQEVAEPEVASGGEVPGTSSVSPPPAGWATGPLGAVQAADREIARQTAIRARAVAEFAAARPASADRPAGQPGAMSEARRAARPEVLADVSEWAVQELVVALSLSAQAAEQLLTRSLTLVHRLPATLAALERGELHPGHLWPMLERVAPIADAAKRAAVERELLAWMSGRVTTPAQLGAKARRLGLARDAHDVAARLAASLRERGVSVRSDRREGMAAFGALLTVPEAQALLDALGRYADALDEPDDSRTRGQKMADCLLDLVLRPEENDLPAVQAQLTVVAGVRALLGGDQPGEIGGEPVPAEVVRALARALGLLPGAAPDPGEASTTSAPTAAPPPTDDRPVDAWPDDVRPTDAWPDDVCPTEAWPLRTWPAEWREANERWWAEVETRALRGEWGGADYTPEDELLRRWAEEAPFEAWFERAGAFADLAQPADLDAGSGPGRDPGPSSGSERDPDSSPGSGDSGFQPETAPDHRPAADPAPRTGLRNDGDGGDGGDDDDSAASARWATAHGSLQAAADALLYMNRAIGHARRTVDDAQRADREDESTWLRSAAGRVTGAPSDLEACAAAEETCRAALAALLDASGGGTLVDRPRIAVIDELTGALLALTDSRELRRLAHCDDAACRRAPARCMHDLTGRPGLGPPGPTDGYRPGAALDRYLRTRDRRCRFPGCRRRVPLGGELDHDRPWPEGPTSAENLTGFCTGHHRGKHQAPGWRYELAPDGRLTVTTPTGLTATTTPPPF